MREMMLQSLGPALEYNEGMSNEIIMLFHDFSTGGKSPISNFTELHALTEAAILIHSCYGNVHV